MSTQGEAMGDVTDADREKAAEIVEQHDGVPWDLFQEHQWGSVTTIAAALAEEREKGIDIGLQNATSIDHYEVGHCCRLCGETWPCDRARTVGLR